MRRAHLPDLSERIAKVLALDPSAPALEFERPLVPVGRSRRDGGRGRAARRAGRTGRGPAAQPPAARRSAARPARAPVRASSPRTPSAGPNGCAPTSRRSASAPSPASAPTSTRSRRQCGGSRATRSARSTSPATAPAEAAATRQPGVAVEMLTSGTTGRRSGCRSPTRRSRRVLVGRQALRAQRRRRAAVAVRHHHRQLAAGAPRRPVPHPAVRERRPFVLPARALPRRRMGRRGAPAPAAHGQPRAGRAAHGARRGPRPGRPGERAVRRLRHRAARLPTTPTRSARSTACPCSSRTPRPSSAVASPDGTSTTTSSSGRRSGAASAARTRGCELRVVDPDTGAPLAPDEEGLLEVKARQLGDERRVDAHDRPRAHRRRRLRVDPRTRRPGDHPRRLQDPTRRRARRARARPARPRRGRRQPARRASRRGAGRRGRAAPGQRRRVRRASSSPRQPTCSRATSSPTSCSWSRFSRVRRRARSISPPCATCSAVRAA